MSFRSTALLLGSLLIGAAAGFAGGYFFGKNKYQALADKEIADVKKLYESHFAPKQDANDENKDTIVKEKQPAPVESNDVYTDYTKKYAGGDVSKELPPEILKGKSKKSATNKKPPYVITGFQLGELEDYKVVTLVYYKDKVLADEDGNIIKNYKEVVGPDALNSFGENDATYVRDDNIKIDYEILLDERSFSDINESDD